jgi:NADH-quinone oxidoreductase subunit N
MPVSEEIINALIRVFPLVVPEAMLVLAACVFFVGGTFRANRHLWGTGALVALGIAAITLVLTSVQKDTGPAIYAGPIYFDHLGQLVKWLALIGGTVLVLLGWNEVSDGLAAEYYGCLLIIVAGLCLTGTANELVTLFLALELISIPTYVVLYLLRTGAAAQEAALKYFLLSVFSSALLLFGFSYLYGLTGTTNLPAIIEALTRVEEDPGTIQMPSIALVALVMVVSGLGFRITAWPFHFYAPDVYQGASTPAVALLAFIPKVAGFVALVRVLGIVWAGTAEPHLAFGERMPGPLCFLAAATMSWGNVMALLQSNIKRLLAYSSMAHSGYMLIGLAAAHYIQASGSELPAGVQAVLFYLAAYGAMTIGAFGILAYLSTPERPVEMEDDLSGLSRSHPGVALLMALFLFSLIGIPLTAGFNGKLLLFLGALGVDGDRAVFYRYLALIAAINVAIGAWYYLRIVAKMYLHIPIKPLEKPRARPILVALWFCAAVTLFLGIYPAPMAEQASRAAGLSKDSKMEDRRSRIEGKTRIED